MPRNRQALFRTGSLKQYQLVHIEAAEINPTLHDVTEVLNLERLN